MLRRRDEIIGEPDDSAQLPWVKRQGITLVRGRAGWSASAASSSARRTSRRAVR